MPPQAAATGWPLTAFSPDGLHLAVASSDGRLKTYDTGSGRVVLNIAEDGRPAAERHTAVETANPVFEHHTALAWVSPGGTADQLVVLGTATGDVKAHSASSGKLLWRATAVSEGGVAAVAWAEAAGALYAAGADRQLARLNPGDGSVLSRLEAGQHPLAALAVTPDGARAFAASAAVTAWELAGRRRLFKFTGHPAAARSIAITADGQYAASVAAGERHVAIWQADGSPSKKTRSAAGVLSLEHAAVSAAMRAEAANPSDGSGSSSTGGFFVAAVSEAAELYVWLCTPAAAAAERRVSTQLIARVMVGASREERGGDVGILAAQLTGDVAGGGTEVQIARSSWALPVFQRLALRSAAASATVVLPPKQGGILLPHEPAAAPPASGGAAAQQQQQRPAPFMLGPDNAEEPLQLRGRTVDGASDPAAASDATRRKRRHPGDADEVQEGGNALPDGQGFGEAPLPGNGMLDGDAAAAGYETSDEEEPSDLEPTLGERVAALQLEERRRVAALAGEVEEAAHEDSRGGDEAEVPLKAIKADSLAVLLTQALRSEDKALLERCLAVSSPDIIANTVSRLQAPDAALLLRAGVARLQSRPRRGSQLTAWLQALVATHTAFFIAAPGARTTLTALYQCIEARLANRQALTSLHGRLELLAAQPQPGDSAAPVSSVLKPQTVYLAGDSSDEEQATGDSEDDEDMLSDSESEEGWDTGEDGDSAGE